MLWTVSAGSLVLLLIPIVPLLERRIRQARTSVRLRIEDPRGIVDEGDVPIGGIEQWVSIRGEDANNPVLLVLHGGPGCSYSVFTPHLRSWQKHFTVVQWDQRGAGRTLARTGKLEGGPMSFAQLTCDAVEVAEAVRMRLGKERIFLLASSIGSTFGMRLARQRPDLFHAYIGTDQNVGMNRARDENHKEVLDRLRALGLSKGVRALEQIDSDPTRWRVKDFETVTRWTMRSDPQGYRRTMKLLKNAVWYAPGWTLKDIRRFVAGMRYSLQKLLSDITTFDAWEEGSCFEIPFFIFQGQKDVLTRSRLAKDFFDEVIAPEKRFVSIENAGHFAAFLEPDEFLRQLLLHVRPLSDVSGTATMV